MTSSFSSHMVPLSLGHVPTYPFQVISALHYLHTQLSVIHRDVKPSNILINRSGQCKMCDFGISGYLVDSVAKTIDAGCKPYMAVSETRWQTALRNCTDKSHSFSSRRGSTPVETHPTTTSAPTFGPLAYP